MTNSQKTPTHDEPREAKTLEEAFGIPLSRLHILDEDGKAVSDKVRKRVIDSLLDEPVKVR